MPEEDHLKFKVTQHEISEGRKLYLYEFEEEEGDREHVESDRYSQTPESEPEERK